MASWVKPDQETRYRMPARVSMRQSFTRRIKLGVVLIALICGSLLAQAPSSATNEAAAAVPGARSDSKAHDNSYIIGNADVLAINVWKEQELTRSIPVRLDGKISLPLVGEIQATGLTPLQLEGDIAAKLRNYISELEVTVIVQEINSQKFNILGQVMKPGSYSLTTASTVLDAIAAAGGFRDFAKQKSIYVLRKDATGGETRIPFNYKDVIKGRKPEQNIKLMARDTIVVP